jgi:uncharacterized protein
VRVADRFVARLLGLSLLDPERAGPALLIPGCRSVHTFGMRFAIEVVFLDSEGRVLARRAKVPPGRVVREPAAVAALERPVLAAGRDRRWGRDSPD